MEHDKLPTTQHTRPLPSMEPVHCENCFDWIKRYYWDAPYIQEHLNQVVTHNSMLEREICPNWDLSCKRGLGLASLVKLSTDRSLVIRCETRDGATRVGASDRGWKRSFERGSRKCRNKTRNEMVSRRSGNAKSPRWNLCRSRNRNIQHMISGGKCWCESR